MELNNHLMERLAAPDNLLSAWRAVRGNIPVYRRQRSAGPDGITLTEFERDLSTQLLTLRHLLLKGNYHPQSPGVIEMKKRSGGTRQICILNVTDRVAQRAAQQVIEPLFEPEFLPCNFGFRPGRSVRDAVYCARRLRQHGYGWVVDGDIATCFDSLDHDLLLQKIQKRITDNRVLKLIQKWINVGIMQGIDLIQKSNPLSDGIKKISGSMNNGLNWALNTISRKECGYPLSDSEFDHPEFHNDPVDAEFEQNEIGGRADQENYYEPCYPSGRHDYFQKKALQRFAADGLLLGTGWVKDKVIEWGPSALASLKTQAGRELLKKTLITGSGVAGAATGIALTAYFLQRRVIPPSVGVLQGSPLSPLLANIYLHSFDVALTRAGYRMVRFADDWVILCPDKSGAETAYNQSILALAQIHLKVNPEKTHILSPADQLEWLGETIS